MSDGHKVDAAHMVPDFYARLEVDPGADRAAIEAALLRKQPAWSMGTRNPKNRHTYQLFLDEIPALRRALLGDPASRAAYDAELAVAHRAEREKKLDELQRLVRLRAARGGLAASDRADLVAEARRIGLDEDDLLRLIRPIPSLNHSAPVEADDPDIEPTPDVLDPSTRRQLRVALDHLGRRDLYDALGVARDAPAGDIEARGDAERQRWMRKSQVTAEKTAWLEVIAHAQTHLGSPRSRARYDRTLLMEADEALDRLVEFAIRGLDRLDPGTRSALLAEAAALGIAPDRADRRIARACRKLGVGRDPAVGVTASHPATASANGSGRFAMVRCRGCGGVTEISPVARRAASARCPHCGASMRWDCPACRRTPWVDEPRCACGFRQVLAEPVRRHFEAAQAAFRASDLDLAEDHLERLLELTPDHAGARNAVNRVRQRRGELDRLRSAYQSARTGGRLVAARAAVEAWGRLVDPSSAEIRSAWDEITPPLRRAEAMTARARAVERTDPPAARNFYRQSLAIVSDLPDALAGLARTPPDPPLAMEAQVLGDRIRLTWTPPPSDGCGPIRYVVVRKRGGVLIHPGDGVRIAEVDAPEFDDRTVPPGETVGYAVLSRRGEAESIAAVSLGPFVYLADVSEVEVALEGGAVAIRWRAPASVAEVRAVRKRGLAPSGPRDGDRIPATLDHLVDRGLDPDAVHYYLICAIYRMSDGRLFPSPGVPVSVRPGAAIASTFSSVNRDRLSAGGLADPTDLRAMRSGGDRVTLRWEWSSGSIATRIVARRGVPPAGPEDPSAVIETVPRDEYERRGSWGLALPVGRGGSWHVRIWGVEDHSLSPGIAESAATTLPGLDAEVVVSYAVRRPLLPFQPWSLTLRTDPPGASLPPMVVVEHPRAVPLSVDDGRIVARVPSAGDGVHVPIPGRRRDALGLRLFVDPTASPDGLIPIRFRHPETGATRV